MKLTIVGGGGFRVPLVYRALLDRASVLGLTELVLLSVGLQAGLLDAQLYTVLVATAVLTTVATGPLLAAIDRGRHVTVTRPVPPVQPVQPV